MALGAILSAASIVAAATGAHEGVIAGEGTSHGVNLSVTSVEHSAFDEIDFMFVLGIAFALRDRDLAEDFDGDAHAPVAFVSEFLLEEEMALRFVVCDSPRTCDAVDDRFARLLAGGRGDDGAAGVVDEKDEARISAKFLLLRKVAGESVVHGELLLGFVVERVVGGMFGIGGS